MCLHTNAEFAVVGFVCCDMWIESKAFCRKKNSWEMRSQRALVTDWNWRSLEWHKYTLFSQYNTQQRITQCLGGKANEHTVQRIRMIQWHKVKGISNDQNVQSIHEIHFDILTFIVNIKIKKTQWNNEIGQPYENRTWQKFFISVRCGGCWFFFYFIISEFAHKQNAHCIVCICLYNVRWYIKKH